MAFFSKKRRSEGEGSSSRGPRIDTMGLRNLTVEHKKTWERLTKPGRTIQETKFVDLDTLDTLGLRESVQQLLGKVGLREFLGYSAYTYERYTLEFLSTLTKWKDEDGPHISFHLNDELYTMHYAEVMEAFGWDYVPDGDFLAKNVFDEATFYSTITHGSQWHPRVKNSSLPHPALRYVHRFLSMAVFCHGEPTNLPKLELRYLWTMTPEGIGCPDWVTIFIEGCLDVARRDSGKLSMGGMVTLLAEYLEVDVPEDEDGNPLLQRLGNVSRDWRYVYPSNVYNIDQLKKANMLWTPPQNSYHYIWIFGARSVRYMVLPQRDKTLITPNTTHEHLYVPPDEQYRVGVEEELGRRLPQQQEEGEEEGEQEQQQPHFQQQQPYFQPQPHYEPQQPPRQPFEDPYAMPVWHSMLESRMDAFETTQHNMELRLDSMQGHMDSMHGQMDGMEDHMYSMSSMMNAMNQFYISHYPEYRDPTQEIEERRLERQRHRSQRRYGGGQGPSGSH